MISTLTIALFLNAPAPEPQPAPAADPAPAEPGSAPPANDGGGNGGDDVTYYQFTGLGIDGELRTPALLQFLSRIGGEFETVGIPHRSFMPELQQTIMEDSL